MKETTGSLRSSRGVSRTSEWCLADDKWLRARGRERFAHRWVAVLVVLLTVAWWPRLVQCQSSESIKAQDKALNQWIKKLRDKKYPVRTQAATALGQIGPPAGRAVPTLIDALDDDRSGVPQWADGKATFKLEDPEAKQFRDAAVNALARIGEPAVPALVAGLKDSRQLVRVGVAEALEKFAPIPPQVDTGVLVPALSDQNPWVRGSAVRMLVKLGDSSVPSLTAALQQGETAQARAAAARALRELGRAAKLAVPALTAALKDSDSEVRREAADTLEQLSPVPEAVPVLRGLLTDGDEDVRLAAAAALARNGVAEVVPFLVKLLRETTKEPFRPVAAGELISPIFAAIVNLAGEAAERKAAEKRVKAARALGYLGPAAKDAVTVLKEALADKNEDVRSAARKALATIE